MRLPVLPLLIALVTGLACREAAPARPASESPAPPLGVVDSALPIPLLLDRFRATVADTPAALAGGATSPSGSRGRCSAPSAPTTPLRSAA